MEFWIILLAALSNHIFFSLNFIYFFLGIVLHGLSLVVASGVCSAVEVLGLIVLASLPAEHKRRSCGTQAQLLHSM